MDEKERLREVRRLTDRLGELNSERHHLRNFVEYASGADNLQQELQAMLKKRERESIQVHKTLVKLATKPKGYQSAGMLIQSRKERAKHGSGSKKR